MSAIGIPEERLVLAIINPETRRPISPVTLRKHFREELDQGLVQADVKAASNLLKLTETSAAAAIFWAKCRLRWRERDAPMQPTPDGSSAPGALSIAGELERRSMFDIGRRIAFVLAMAAEQAPLPAAPEKKAA